MIDRLCSLDSRSFVDTLSNLCRLDGLTAWQAVPGVEEGRLPASLLPVFRHEVTHHWTLFSPVGTALTVVKISAARALLGRQARQKGLDPGDYAKYLLAGCFLRAWSEGLAQYAEFDATYGAARSSTFVMACTWSLFCRSAFLDSEQRESAVNGLLQESRLTRHMVERKANALRYPFTVRTGGYLPGYLAVKRLANRLRAAGGRFEDTDLVLSYLKSFVFDDPQLVRLLLKAAWPDVPFFEHLRQRFDWLLSRSDDQIRQIGVLFDDEMASRTLGDSMENPFIASVASDPKAMEDAGQTLVARLQALEVDGELLNSSDDTADSPLRNLYSAVFWQRNLLCLAVADVGKALTARLRSGENVILIRTPDGNILLLSHMQRERYVDLKTIETIQVDPETCRAIEFPRLSLEVWLAPYAGKAYLLLLAPDGARIGVHTLLGSGSLDELPWDAISRDRAIDTIALLNQALPEALVRQGADTEPLTLREATASLSEWIDEQVDSAFAWLAFPAGRAAELQKLFSSRGLAALPSYKPDGLRGLAVMPLAAASGLTALEVCDRLQLPEDYLDLASKLLADLQRTKWPAHADGHWYL